MDETVETVLQQIRDTPGGTVLGAIENLNQILTAAGIEGNMSPAEILRDRLMQIVVAEATVPRTLH